MNTKSNNFVALMVDNMDITFRATKTQKVVKAYAKIDMLGIMSVDNIQVREDKIVWPFTANAVGTKTYFNRDIEVEKKTRETIDKLIMAEFNGTK